ncbi:prolyl-tRNA synthetase associated domain-containing protein [Chakrabartyella piscis]|uniref:prolyl-tRNA synthetase associated domain-containing protein n=1 Tax=Chakrabartyella piscis TaxID=2918914 RepID=UPI00295848F7|nr:prolyl-tRNA synthetase associated domain-containing protein [Chakrabartyella piscis]
MYHKEEVRNLLQEEGVSYRWVDHEAAYTIEDMERMGIDADAAVAKNLFLRDQKGKKHYLVVLCADKQVNLRSFGETFDLGKLSFASEERLMKYLGLTKGSVTPFGILNDINCEVRVFIDKDLEFVDELGVHPNDNCASVFLSMKDLISILSKFGNDISFVEIPNQ